MCLHSHEKDNKSVEGLLALANTFITASRTSARQRICALGEPLLNGLIRMWKRCQPAMRVREGEGKGEVERK